METEFVLSLGEQQWTLPPGADTITIGRASNADVRLPADDQISRIHARLTRDGTTWTLHDESRNGTGLNGRRLTTPTPLTPNDRIHIGRSVLTFQTATPDVSPSPPAASPAPSAPAPPPAATLPDTPAAHRGPSEAAPAAHRGPAEAASTPYRSSTDAAPADGSTDAAPAEPGPAAFPGVPEPAPPAYPGPAEAAAYPGSPEPVYPDDPAPQAAAYPDLDEASSAPAVYPGSGEHAPTYSEEAAPQAPANYSDPDGAASAYPEEPAPQASAADSPFVGWREGQSVGELDPNDEWIGFEPDEPKLNTLETAAPPPVPPDLPRRPDESWAAYPSAANPEPARSPWQNPAQFDQVEPNWNESAGWPEPNDPARTAPDRRTTDRRAGDRRTADRRTTERRTPNTPTMPERDSADLGPVNRREVRPRADLVDELGSTPDTDDEEVGTVRLLRVLVLAGVIIGIGLIVNLIGTFLADGPGSSLRWLIPPGVALVASMVLALIDAAAPRDRARGRLDVSIMLAIAVVLVGVGVGGFAITAGAEYVAGYATGNESGEDRLVKPVARPVADLTFTVENVTYTSHFTRIEVAIANRAKEAVTVPIAGSTFTAADGTTLRADTGRSAWPDRLAPGTTTRGTITFKGKLPDSATTAALTFKSGESAVSVTKIALSN